jgi:beta-galactosidase
LPLSVTVASGTSPDGRRVHVVHNWIWEPAELPAPTDLTDILDGSPIPDGTPVTLGAWDVRVLVEG